MAASAPGTPSSLTPPQWLVYAALGILLIGSVAASYWLKIFPTAFGQIGGGASIVAIFGFASHDFEQEGVPAGWPRWTSFVVVSIASIGMGAIGAFTGQTLLSVGAFVTWLTLVLGLIFHALSSDGGTNFSQNSETWAIAIIGAFTSLLVYWLDNPMAGIAALVAAGVPIFGMYFHVAAGSVTPVANPPAPPTPAAPAST